MAVVHERREACDGCGRTVPIDELTTVTMPDGERLACCPNCAPHARAAAEKLSSIDRPQRTCDGCEAAFSPRELEDVVLRDGTVVSCCPDCLSEVPGRRDGTDDRSAGGDSGTAATTELATRRNLCSQCHEWHDVELFHVRTIDGRTEELCPDCKAIAEDEGVVEAVKMRRSRAREILDVGEEADDQQLREAFLEQAKSAHPDRRSGTESAFKLVKDAYDRLS